MRSSSCCHFSATARALAGVLVAFLLGSAARLGAQTLDAAFNPATNAEVLALAAQPDGKILLGGNFSTVNSVARQSLARLNADGTLDTTFNAGVSTTVYSILVQPDGKILLGGGFTLVGGTPRARIARVNADGSLDTAFSPAADAIVSVFALQPDGKILVGGQFTQLGGAARAGLARLNSDGSLDAAFDAGLSGTITSASLTVQTIVVQGDGKILIGGNFAQAGGPNVAALPAAMEQLIETVKGL